MKRRVHSIWAILTSAMIACTGCRPQQPFYLREDGDLSHYLDVATDLDYPDVETATLAEVSEAHAPYTLENIEFANYWDLTLEDALQTSLQNSKVFRSLGGRFVSSAFNNRAQVGEAPDSITLGPDQVRTVYDPALVETTPFTGVESALAAFDTQWSNNLFFQHNDRQQNVQPQGVVTDFFLQVFEQETSTFNTALTKVTAQGGQFSVRNNIVYDLNNNPTRQVPKDWNVNYEVAFTQPLLAGAGAEFNRIAGPFNPFTNIPGGAQLSPGFDGVMLARINVDVALADFEGGVRNLVNDTEQAYWELSFAWRNLETANTALNSARQTWTKIYALYRSGSKGGEANAEAQAREQFYQFKSQAQTLLNELFRAENRLRYVMGLSATDGRLVRPMDRPTIAKVEFDWCEITEEALARNLDLRRQKWRIKQRELELIAAKNLLLPRLDFNGTYRWLGLGDDLFGTRDTEYDPDNLNSLTGSSALQTLASGQFQEWQMGFQSTMTIGFRKELVQVRHYQLQLARERAKLQDEELELSHQLSDAVRQLIYNYELTQTNFNRTLAADRQVEAQQAAYDSGTVTLDQLLEAQRRRAEAQTSFFRTLLDYQRAIITVHYRKGSLLEYNNVYLQEGPWPEKAQFDAHRMARQRDAGVYVDYGFTRPSVVSEGGVRQNPEGIAPAVDAPGFLPEDGDYDSSMPMGAEPMGNGAELVPTPAAGAMYSPEGVPASGLAAANPPDESLNKRFTWGQLGLSGEKQASQDSTWSRIAGMPEDQPATRTASAALQQPRAKSTQELGAAPSPSGGGSRMVREKSINRVNHQQPTDEHESQSHQPTDSTAGGAASR